MKRFLGILYFILLSVPAFSQVETGGQTLPDEDKRYKDFGGFMLDMGSMLDVPTLMLPPTLNFRPWDTQEAPLTIQPNAFQFTPNATYSAVHSLSPYSIYSLLYPHAMGGNVRWQGATYKLNNGMRLTTYGEYDADGYKVHNPAALPWEKNNFNAAFELKSANGKFGVRFEVKSGRNYPY